MSTNPSFGDLLRKAAAKLRETAAAVQHAGPWAPDENGTAIFSADVRPYGAPCVANGLDDGDAAWIALMHPGLAEPLAAWLEETARQYEMPPCDHLDGLCNSCERRDDFVYAGGVARVILGETTGQAK